MNNFKIIICGFGNIGRHILNEFKMLKDSITIYDKYKYPYNNDKALCEHYDYAFICVPTEMNPDGSANTDEVFDIVEKINAGTIIVKSAIPVGTCVLLGKENVICSPEFYGTTQHSLESPNFCILGGNKEYASKTVQLYQQIKTGSFRFIFTDWKTAELSKYMENCWIAAKVTFCNEFANIAAAYDINYEELRECFIADERVSPSHTFVYKAHPYYDSHCLNKDIPALITMCDKADIDTPLMDSILSIKGENICKQHYKPHL